LFLFFFINLPNNFSAGVYCYPILLSCYRCYSAILPRMIWCAACLSFNSTDKCKNSIKCRCSWSYDFLFIPLAIWWHKWFQLF